MAYNATVIAASLDDKELRNSIDNLVQYVEDGTRRMGAAFDATVAKMQNALTTLGKINTTTGSNAMSSDTQATQKNIAAHKELKMTLDEQAAAQSRANNASTLRMYDEQLEKLKRRLMEVRQDIDIFNHAIGSGKATQVSWGQEGLRKAKEEAERLMATISALERQRHNLVDIMSPTGHSLENYVKSLTQANPELALLNDQLRRGVEITKQQATEQGKVTSEIQAQIERIQNKKGATNAFEQISLMPSNNIDEIRAKGLALQALLEKVRDTPLLSQTNVKLAQKLLTSLGNQYAELKKRQEQLAQAPVANASANGAVRRSQQEELQNLEQLKERERQRQQEIIKTGLAAQNQAAQIRESISAQMQAADYTKQIDGVKELQNALRQMQDAARQPMADDTVRTRLEQNIALSKEAVNIAQRYNMTVAGMGGIGIGGKAPTDTLSAYSAELRRLTNIFQNLSAEERKAAAGLGLVNKVQSLQRETQKLRQELSRPISFNEAVKGAEKTLDDLAYKIQRLQSYKQGIDISPTNKNAAEEIAQVDRKIAEYQKTLQKYSGDVKQATQANNTLTRSWNYMKNRLAFYFTVGASTQFIKNLIEVRSQYEMNERALGILVNSAERGTEIFNQLSQMSLVSPYTLIELSSAAKQLVAYDVAAKDVVDTTRRLADMAAAVGVPMERLTYALGQIKAYGYLNSRDNRMFANAGIPLVKQLADYYTQLEGKLVSTADVYTRIKKKAVDYNDVMQVIYRMTDEGGRFFDFQAKMADTLKVRIANLTLAWNNMLNDMGKETQGVLTKGIGLLRNLFLHWKQIDNAFKTAAWAAGLVIALRALNVLLVKMGLHWRILSKEMTATEIAGKKVAVGLATVGSSLKKLVTTPLTWWSLLAYAIVDAARAFWNINEAQENFNKSLREGAKDNYQNIQGFLEQYHKERDLLSDFASGGMSDVEAQKLWVALQEQIELTTKASKEYIVQLMAVENIQERLRQGFALLEDIQVVNAALKELDDNGVKINSKLSAWWNLGMLRDGLIENLKDYKKELDTVTGKYGDINGLMEKAFENGHRLFGTDASNDLKDLDASLGTFRHDLEITTESLLNFIELKGWQGDVNKINEVFAQFGNKLASDNGLDPQSAYLLQREIEEARSKAAKEATAQRLNDLAAAYQVATDENAKKEIIVEWNKQKEIYDNWETYNGRTKVEWERFTKWMKEQHVAETTEMFRDMDAEDIRSLNFQEGAYNDFVTRMVTKYAKEHKMSYDEAFKYLRHWVLNANQWSIVIPFIITTEDKKSVYQQLGEYDALVDEADTQIERLTTRIKELKAQKKLDKKETEELTRAERELKDAEDTKAKAEAQGGHGKKEEKDAKKEQKQQAKAQRQAESELQKALKDEISLLDKARSTYKSLTKDGVSSARAIEVATSGYEDSLAHINAVLRKYGVAEFDIKKYVGTANPRDMRDALRAQLDTLKNLGVAKPVEIKDLEVKLKDLNVDSLTFDQKTLTDSLNNELNKIKESYEFAVELDADPELGGIFLDTLGISKEELAELPKTAAEVARLAQAKINEELAKNDDTKNLLFNLDDMLNRSKFTEWVEVNGHTLDDELTKQLKSYVDYVNKLRLDETKKTIQEWDKLLDKYAEYETKRKRIMEEAQHEREVAQRKNAPQEIFDAINQRERRDLAKVDFERFQETPTWITATGDLARLSDNALGLLIERIREYKKNAKDLDPKQIKQLNRALSQLYKEQRKDNPFSVFADAYDQAKERFNDYQVAIDVTEAEIEKLRKKEGVWTMEESARYNELIDTLRKLRQEQDAVSEISVVDITKGFQAIAQLADNAAGQIKEMADALGGSEMADGLKQMADLFGKAASMAVTGAQIGGAWGAVAGAAVGLLSGIITTFGNEFSGNASITRKIEASELAVRRLESASKDLERALDKAYGVGTIGAQNLIVLNRKLQLVELERQLALEKSRKEKNKDKDKIMEIEDKIKDIKFEIEDMLDSITNDLLGISSVGDAVESMVDAITDALRGGEDAIEAFNESVDDMIINLVKKFVQTKYLAPIMEDAWAKLNAVVLQRTAPLSSEVEMLEREKAELQARYDYYDSILSKKKDRESNLPPLERKLEEYDRKIEEAKARLVEASMPTDADLNQWIGILDALKLQGSPIIEMYRQLLDSLGLGSTSSTDTELSALQQGIQGITESTANALEAYASNISQQVYFQSDILAQIRDMLQLQTLDVQTVTTGEILLQLQASYITQEAIRSTLEGWNNATGQAVRVELIS